MKPETEKSINTANVLLGIGTLLLVVPIGFGLISLMTVSGEPPVQAMISLGWICLLIFSLIPIGLGLFIGGLTWMTYLRKRAKSEEIAEDAQEETDENQ